MELLNNIWNTVKGGLLAIPTMLGNLVEALITFAKGQEVLPHFYGIMPEEIQELIFAPIIVILLCTLVMAVVRRV